MRGIIAALGALVMSGALTGIAAATVAYPSAYPAVRTDHSLAGDTRLSDPDWVHGKIADGKDAFEDVTTRSAAPLETAAYVLYDTQNLYVAFRAQQSNVPIITNQSTNNIGFGLDDFVGVGVDPSGNG